MGILGDTVRIGEAPGAQSRAEDGSARREQMEDLSAAPKVTVNNLYGLVLQNSLARSYSFSLSLPTTDLVQILVSRRKQAQRDGGMSWKSHSREVMV